MNLDLRLPMGTMFSITGAVLFAFGLATRMQPDLYTRSLGINANLWWGLVLLVFGLIVVGIGRRGQGEIEARKGGVVVQKRPKKR
jgi:hypothetical protein